MLHKNAQCLIQWRRIRGQIAFLRDLQIDKESNANATRVENPRKCVMLWSLLIIVWTRGGEQKVDEKGEVWQQSVSEEFDDPKIFENPKVIPNGSKDLDDPKIVWRSQVLKVEQKVVEKGEVGQQSLLEDHEARNTWRAAEQEGRASWKKPSFFSSN